MFENHCLCFCSDEPNQDYSLQSQLTVPSHVANADSSPETSPIRPLPRSVSTANLQSASKLIHSSKLVYSKRLDLPHGVEVIRATPSAGWKCQPSCNIYSHTVHTYIFLLTFFLCHERKSGLKIYRYKSSENVFTI